MDLKLEGYVSVRPKNGKGNAGNRLNERRLKMTKMGEGRSQDVWVHKIIIIMIIFIQDTHIICVFFSGVLQYH